ncbi:hypothetical protein EVAR_95843_1 [Eumeta japonica]|uniref:Uncharacterized protein n=1 Tax=Eumeta variegata TaxID=151549 RepID=A0A4C1VLU1_EUMVA|nr:hypothetical protein EVAR_95843_1 [Eumeta japonica]
MGRNRTPYASRLIFRRPQRAVVSPRQKSHKGATNEAGPRDKLRRLLSPAAICVQCVMPSVNTGEIRLRGIAERVLTHLRPRKPCFRVE